MSSPYLTLGEKYVQFVNVPKMGKLRKMNNLQFNPLSKGDYEKMIILFPTEEKMIILFPTEVMKDD